MYWLSALSMPEALREGLQMFGLWSEELEGRCRGFSTQVIALCLGGGGSEVIEPPF